MKKKLLVLLVLLCSAGCGCGGSSCRRSEPVEERRAEATSEGEVIQCVRCGTR